MINISKFGSMLNSIDLSRFSKYVASLISFTVVAIQPNFCQSLSTGHSQMIFVDQTRNNREVEIEVYYPSDTPGENTALAIDNGNKFPVIAFGHGFFMSWDSYEYLWNLLTSNGFIVAFPTTESGLAPSHEDFGKDLAFVLGSLKNEALIVESPFYDKIDSTSCVMGHSMGGGAAHLAASFNPSITAIVSLAAAETTPSAISASGSISVPALIFAGVNDCITPIAEHQQPMYDALASACKTLISIDGASHCQFAGNNVACSFGEFTCSPSAEITADEQHAIVASFLIPWLRNYLKNDCNQGLLFQNSLSDAAVSYQQNCSVCSSVSTNHPADEFASLRLENNCLIIKSDKNQQLELRITDTCGKVVRFESVEVTQRADNSFRLYNMSGVYIISVSDGKHLNSIKILIHLD